MLLLQMLGRDAFTARFEEVENIAAASNSLAIEELFYNPKKQGRIA